MSRLMEYIKLLPAALANPEKVIEGWVNAAKMNNHSLTEDQEAEIIRRRAICQTCPNMSLNAPGYKTSREDDHCTLCGCPIATKTASLSSSCGALTYNQRHPNSPKEEVRWTAYENK